MYAIISDSGQQFKVSEGQIVDLDYRAEANRGDQIVLDRVLAVSADGSLRVGSPVVEGARVSAEVIGARLGPKLVIQKFRRRKTYRRKTGHRQVHTRVRIDKIELP